MAKLNGVTVVVSSITVGGVSYVESTEKAEVGDIIRYEFGLDDDYTVITDGGYYVVTDVDSCGDAHVDGDDGDDFDTIGDTFVVFKRASISAETTANTITHEGTTYNVVRRNVRDGDRFIVVTESRYKWKTVGRIYAVTRINSDGDPNIIDNDGDDTFVINGNYSVLEPIEPALPKRTVVGDKIRITRYEYGAPEGTVGTVIERTDERIRYSYGGDGDMKYASHGAYEVVTAAAPLYREVKRKANVGERIRIVAAELTGGRYANGAEFIVKETVSDNGTPHVKVAEFTRPILDREYVVLEPLESAPPTKPARLKVGEYAVVNEGATGFIKGCVGKVTQITEDDGTNGIDAPFIVSTVDGVEIGAAYIHEVRRATQAEIDAALRSALWTKLGRKVDEFHVGDIVKARSTVGYIEDNGGLLVGIRDFSGNFTVYNKSNTTLIATAESRLDGKAV
jgi:hypothetical protein